MNPDSLPSIWREELWHPFWVHLPLALLTIATFSELLGALPSRAAQFLKNTSLYLLLVGIATAWLSVYLGDIAEEVVNKVICDPTATHAHEDMAMLASYIFSAALLVKLVCFFKADWLPRTLSVVSLMLMITGTYYLVYTGHLGATLVYNQGAGVYKPSAECREFE